MFDRDNSETTTILRLNHNFPSDLVLLSSSKEVKVEGTEFPKDPVRHVNQRCHVPDTGERESIRNKRPTGKGQGADAPGCQTLGNRVNVRLPICHVEVTEANVNPKNLNQPKTLALSDVQLRARGFLKVTVCLKYSLYARIRGHYSRCIVGIEGDDRERGRDTGQHDARTIRVVPKVDSENLHGKHIQQGR